MTDKIEFIFDLVKTTQRKDTKLKHDFTIGQIKVSREIMTIQNYKDALDVANKVCKEIEESYKNDDALITSIKPYLSRYYEQTQY